MILVVMGVAGSGKTTIAQSLAARLGWPYQEGDTLHPPANVAKMSAGIPLTDADRLPWLHAIAAIIDTWRAQGTNGIVTCSALRRTYRDILIGPRPDVRLVHLAGAQPLVAARMTARTNHFMPPTLLDSQFATLEPPGPDERPITVDIGPDPDAIALQIIKQIKQESSFF